VAQKSIEELLKDFTKEYMKQEPYCSYVNFIGISDAGLIERMRNKKIKMSNISGERCFYVSLREDLPVGLEIPNTYHGVKVYTRVVGDIRAL